jgi:hypothetical protein
MCNLPFIRREEVVEVRVPSTDHTLVHDANGTTLMMQLIIDAQKSDGSPAVHRLLFAVSLPPLGYTTVFVSRQTAPPSDSRMHSGSPGTQIKTPELEVSFSNTTGRMQSITNRRAGHAAVAVDQQFLDYGSNKQCWMGPWAFTDTEDGPATPIHPGKATVVTVASGPLLHEVQQTWGPGRQYVEQTVRVYATGSKRAVVETVVTVAQPVEDAHSSVVRFDTGVNSVETVGDGPPEVVFFTDGNGMELRKRVLNKTSWGINNVTELVAGNYYPVTDTVRTTPCRVNVAKRTTGAFVTTQFACCRQVLIRSAKEQFAVLTDRAHGATYAHQYTVVDCTEYFAEHKCRHS